MALPKTFANPREYFAAAVDFLERHFWIYETANTCFIANGVLEKMPPDFKQYFLKIDNKELNNFPLVHEHKSRAGAYPPSLERFREELARLTPAAKCLQVTAMSSSNGEVRHKRGISSKKLHEITRLAALVHARCTENELLVDFGAGLGYLDEALLALNPAYRILGLEADEYRVLAARKRYAEQQGIKNPTALSYQQHFINEQSTDFIEAEARKLSRTEIGSVPPSMAIVGLHACADLSITSMRIFLCNELIRRLIIMPCCYHKLQLVPGNANTPEFKNFPLSVALRDVSSNCNARRCFNRPFLRLACQQTMARWRETSAEEHKRHGKQMYLRSLAGAVLAHDATKCLMKRRGANATSTDNFAAITQIYELRCKNTQETLAWRPEHERQCNEIASKYDAVGGGWKLAEALTCLQTAMQKLCENIVLYDRICFMEEQASARKLSINVRFEKLLDDKLSPRCEVLMAEKL